MSTQTFAHTLAVALAEANPNTLADALRAYSIGEHLSPQKWAFSTSPGATMWTITGATAYAGASPGSKTPALPIAYNTLPAILAVGTLRVTDGVSGGQGMFIVGDAGATAQLLQVAGASGGQTLGAPGIARLSDDGTTLTFPEAVKGFIIEYIPRSRTDVTSIF